MYFALDKDTNYIKSDLNHSSVISELGDVRRYHFALDKDTNFINSDLNHSSVI